MTDSWCFTNSNSFFPLTQRYSTFCCSWCCLLLQTNYYTVSLCLERRNISQYKNEKWKNKNRNEKWKSKVAELFLFCTKMFSKIFLRHSCYRGQLQMWQNSFKPDTGFVVSASKCLEYNTWNYKWQHNKLVLFKKLCNLFKINITFFHSLAQYAKQSKQELKGDKISSTIEHLTTLNLTPIIYLHCSFSSVTQHLFTEITVSIYMRLGIDR